MAFVAGAPKDAPVVTIIDALKQLDDLVHKRRMRMLFSACSESLCCLREYSYCDVDRVYLKNKMRNPELAKLRSQLVQPPGSCLLCMHC